jgi:hypothetical protein
MSSLVIPACQDNDGQEILGPRFRFWGNEWFAAVLNAFGLVVDRIGFWKYSAVEEEGKVGDTGSGKMEKEA